ncbi:hypothetical protein ZIOFF_059335 [Zingiber officinale]|uniref:LysM domain-containing protein n=1 Tax=Zingiber officinale TaxID=94328 RepID=A0A8J5FA52_ZINOF|nr:hypothetical protein ZIOFF_059335 [Zingiber officinale]
MKLKDLDSADKSSEQAVSTVCKYHDPIIDERIEKWRSGEKKEVEDLLDVMISLTNDSGKPILSTEEIKAQCAEFIYAAVDNPSNTAEWLLAHLLEQPDIMRKAVEELDRVVGKERLVVESDFARLPYVKACAREALRLHPIAPFNLPHVAIDDAVVSNYFIPKGSMVLLGRAVLGRNPKEFMYAAVDNPSITAEWLLAHLLEQPDIMRKAVEELDRVVGKERLVVESDFARLPYVKACAREALRLHPIAPFNLPHVAIDDAFVSNYFIPKGSMVLLGRAVLGRNPKVKVMKDIASESSPSWCPTLRHPTSLALFMDRLVLKAKKIQKAQCTNFTSNLLMGSLSHERKYDTFAPPSSPCALKYIEHHISKLDTLASVAIKYGVEIVDIKRTNGLTTYLQLFAHKILLIRLLGRHPPSTPIQCNGSLDDSKRIMNFGERNDPPHKGEKEVPEGAPYYLAGQAFVISGTLDR